MGIFTKHPYRKKYYLIHPIKFFSHYYYDLKVAYQRAKKGYSYKDLWEIDNWFLNIFPNMLKEYNKTRCGYPGTTTNKEFECVINDMILYFNNANSKTTDFKNTYEKAYNKIISKEKLKLKKTNNYFSELIIPNRTEEEEEIIKKYLKEELNKQEYMKINLKKGFYLWYKWFYELWD